MTEVRIGNTIVQLPRLHTILWIGIAFVVALSVASVIFAAMGMVEIERMKATLSPEELSRLDMCTDKWAAQHCHTVWNWFVWQTGYGEL